MLLDQTHKEQWTERSKLIFRFTFSYVILYIVLMFTSGLLEAPFRWIGTSILGFNYEFDSYRILAQCSRLCMVTECYKPWCLEIRKRDVFESVKQSW